MVDMVKKIHKKSANLLNPDEEVLGATVISPVGQFKKTVAFGAVGGLVGAAVGQAIGGKAEAPAGGTMAEAFPAAKQAIFARSNQRWVLFEQSLMSGAAKDVLAQWPLDQIQGLQLEKGKLTSRIDIQFSDGSVAQVEAVKGARPDRFVEAAANN